MKKLLLFVLLFMGVAVNAQVANPAPDLYECDVDNDGYAVFDLTVNNTIILGGQNPADFTVTYYETETEAVAVVGVGEIDTNVLYQNTFINTQVIYVRVEENATGNYVANTSVTLNVISSPVLPSDPLIYAQCEDSGSVDGFVVFDLVSYEQFFLYEEIIVAGGNIGDYTTTYYTSLFNGSPDPTSIIANPSAYINTSTPDQVIYAQVENTLTGCSTVKEITLHVALLPTANYTPVYECDDDFFADMDGANIFNLMDYIPQITNGASDVDVSFYTSQIDAENGFGASLISDPTTYINEVNPQTVFVRVYSSITECYVISLLVLHVEPNPTPFTTAEIVANLGVLTGCDGYVYGQGAIFDLTQWEFNILQGVGPGPEAGVSASYYTSYDDAEAGINTIANPIAFQNTSSPQTIYMRVTNDGTGINPPTSGTGCYTIVEFDIELEGCELQQDNLTVETISETCVGLDNGMVQITANEAYTYEVSMSLNGNAIAVSPNTFTDVINISNLASGTYYVCVTATEVNATQCYDVYVEAVENLVGFSGRIGNTYTLELTGSTYYKVLINGVVTEINVATTTETVTFEHELSTEVTTVKVTTDKECQGRFEETVLLDAAKLVIYPNPAVDEIRFSTNAELSSVVVYDMIGKVVLQDVNIKEVVNVTELDSGVYFIKATLGTTVHTFKFIKK